MISFLKGLCLALIAVVLMLFILRMAAPFIVMALEAMK